MSDICFISKPKSLKGDWRQNQISNFLLPVKLKKNHGGLAEMSGSIFRERPGRLGPNHG